MPSTNSHPTTCPHCALTYQKFRTGYSYQDVFEMLWVPSGDPANWVYKRKGSVLRLFKTIKMEMWATHLKTCGKEETRPLSVQEWERICAEAKDY